MRQIKITLSVVFSLLNELFGMHGRLANGQPVKVSPGLMDFVFDVNLKYHLNRIGKKLEDHQKSFSEEDKALKIKLFGEDETKWGRTYMVPENPDIPKTISVDGKESPNPEYKEKSVENENWKEYEDAYNKLLETEVVISIPVLTLNRFDGIDLSYCVPVKRQATEDTSTYFRVSSVPESGESKQALNIYHLSEHIILTPVDDENLKDHEYEKGQTKA